MSRIVEVSDPRAQLSLASSRQLQIQALICQNDAMAMGARKAMET